MFARETLRESKGKPKAHNVTWWWHDEVQVKIKEKLKSFKERMNCTYEVDQVNKRESYKMSRRATKKADSETKNLVFDDFYKKLDAKEGEAYLF